MMQWQIGLPLVCSLVAQAQTLFPDPAYRAAVQKEYIAQRLRSGSRQEALFGVMRQKLSTEEKEALQFLIAGMPLSDLGTAKGEDLLDAVRATHAARGAVPWGRALPVDIYRHFVLPLRVNNEHVDAFRVAMHRELLGRVKGMSMAQAALEINHWCHEKVVYQGTDSRTSAPLATMKTAFGRCGEESTFTVAALRAVGIPARQVYTPRWAHSDDNHAWVEAWIDGKWRFMGACEPEPVLDRGWFQEPVRRAILVHTKAYGPYAGSESVIRASPRFAELNITSNYAPTKEVTVRVVDAQGKPVAGATVDYRLYNYGEFFPVASRTTDASGRTSLATGKGSLLLWARKGQQHGAQVIQAEDTTPATVTLGSEWPSALTFDQIPPVEPPARPDPLPESAKQAHGEKLKAEDRIRLAYTATFLPQSEAEALAKGLGLDETRTWAVLSKGAGNRRELARFLKEAPDKAWALALLETVAEKDLRDTPADILLDHLKGALAAAPALARSEPELFRTAVLNPRIALELLTPWRSAFRSQPPGGVKDAPSVAAWLSREVKLDPEANHARVAVNPEGVVAMKRADVPSRDIAFVAICRSLGIAARLEPALRLPQHWDAARKAWVDAAFVTRANAPTGRLTLKAEGDPKYSIAFTLSRMEAGEPKTLSLGHDKPLSQLDQPLTLPAGDYLAVTGHRQPGGSVLARIEPFTLKAGDHHKQELIVRKPTASVQALGTLDLKAVLEGPAGSVTLADLAGEKGTLLVWAGPGQEPTRHVMAELRAMGSALETWGGRIAFVVPKGARLGPDFDQLPKGALVVHDPDQALLKAASAALKKPLGASLPVVLALTSAGKVTYQSEGYRIGAPGLAIQTLQPTGCTK